MPVSLQHVRVRSEVYKNRVRTKVLVNNDTSDPTWRQGGPGVFTVAAVLARRQCHVRERDRACGGGPGDALHLL